MTTPTPLAPPTPKPTLSFHKLRPSPKPRPSPKSAPYRPGSAAAVGAVSAAAPPWFPRGRAARSAGWAAAAIRPSEPPLPSAGAGGQLWVPAACCGGQTRGRVAKGSRGDPAPPKPPPSVPVRCPRQPWGRSLRLLLASDVPLLLPLLGGLLLPRSGEGTGTPSRVLPPERCGGFSGEGTPQPLPIGTPDVGTPDVGTPSPPNPMGIPLSGTPRPSFVPNVGVS